VLVCVKIVHETDNQQLTLRMISKTTHSSVRSPLNKRTKWIFC